MVEGLGEPLADVLVYERVVGDVVYPGVVLLGGGEFPVDQEVGDFEIGGLLSQLLDGIAAVFEDAFPAVNPRYV